MSLIGKHEHTWCSAPTVSSGEGENAAFRNKSCTSHTGEHNPEPLPLKLCELGQARADILPLACLDTCHSRTETPRRTSAEV